jgi:polyphenol oxidase
LPRVLFKNKSAYLFKKFYSQGVIAAFSDRKRDLGFSAGKDLKKNRRWFLDSLGINYRDLVAGHQVHGCRIVLASQKHKGRGALSKISRLENTDGFITKEANLPLAVFTADCLSIFLLDARQRVVGLVHAGWQGSHQEIVARAVRLMRQRFKSRPQDLIVGFGPAIRKCCYEVGEDFQQLFPSGAIKRRKKLYLDLITVNKGQLLKAGVKRKNILDSGICTGCQNKNFFSFRREKEAAGRMMSVIMLKGIKP